MKNNFGAYYFPHWIIGFPKQNGDFPHLSFYIFFFKAFLVIK